MRLFYFFLFFASVNSFAQTFVCHADQKVNFDKIIIRNIDNKIYITFSYGEALKALIPIEVEYSIEDCAGLKPEKLDEDTQFFSCQNSFQGTSTKSGKHLELDLSVNSNIEPFSGLNSVTADCFQVD
ncbi:MAG: hypothetical protein H6621_06800 [Halobacteriovoraceae bacterium]|nr:hypothetical protein [Halobacteriovoraceae bacterium]